MPSFLWKKYDEPVCMCHRRVDDTTEGMRSGRTGIRRSSTGVFGVPEEGAIMILWRCVEGLYAFSEAAIGLVGGTARIVSGQQGSSKSPGRESRVGGSQRF
jgi:hypothetical protein